MRRLSPFLLLIIASNAWAAFGYYSPISINSAQVPSTQTDFPVLVSVTDARFKTVANSGHVQNANGYDIRPYTSSALSSAITGYELERYNATTGEVVMWVKVSSLSSSTTPIYLAYGDSGISTDGSSTTTWSNSFVGVYHLKDGTTLSVADSTGVNNGTNQNGVTATTGQIDGGGGFVAASNQYVLLPAFTSTAAITLSAWVNGTSFGTDYNPIISRLAGSERSEFFVKSNGKIASFMNASSLVSFDGAGTHTLLTGTWYYVVATYDSSAGLQVYVNASSDGSTAANGALNTGSSAPTIGRQASNSRYWNGTLDEARLASVARSANWITTEYNNQSAPGTFETLGTEVTLTIANNGWFYFFP